MLIWFMMIWKVPALVQLFHDTIVRILYGLGFHYDQVSFFIKAFNAAIFGEPA